MTGEVAPAINTEDNFEVACSLLGWGEPGIADSRAVWSIGIGALAGQSITASMSAWLIFFRT